MRTDDPKMPEYKNSTMAERKAEREGKGTKQVKAAEDKAVKGPDSK